MLATRAANQRETGCKEQQPAESVKFQEVAASFESYIENLKAKNMPDIVNFRKLERLKILNFLRK